MLNETINSRIESRRRQPGAMWVEERIPEATQKELIARGHKLQVAPPWSLASSGAIITDAKTGALSAVADPRVEAYAWEW